MKVQLAGFKALDKALGELPKATGKNVLRRVAKPPMEAMANVAAQKAPERTGRLAFSISVSEKRTRRAKTQFMSGTGIQMAMGPASGFGAALSYATFDEFGTVDTPAFAFMRAAWDGGAERSLEYVKVHLGDEIAKSARKLAVKRAKIGG